MDVLFLSVSTGGGHFKAAEAVKENIERRFPGSRTLIVDTLRYINPVVDKLVVGGYLNAVKSTPQVYGKLYELSESDESVHDLCSALNKLLSFRIRKLISEFMPSVIVCTHTFPLQMLSNLKAKGKIDVPVAAIVTDFVSHPFWVHDNVEAYIVSHDHVKYEMVKRGIPEKNVYPYGIPVSKCFLQKKDRSAILKEMNLEDKTTILIMGGSLGFGEVRDTFKSLLDSEKDFQILVITGHNLKLKKQLEKCALNANKRVEIFSYTNRVSDLMDISDFIITKPGGMTITEALVKSVPIFIISPIPGQEERNAQFLINNGAAANICEYDSADNVLNQVMSNPLRIEHMKQAAGYLARPNSSEDIVNLLVRLSDDGRTEQKVSSN